MNDPRKLQVHVEVLDELRTLIYSQEDGRCGGPLHVVLDDFNLYDRDIESSREWIATNEHGWDPHMLILSTAVLDMLQVLSPAQRHLWWHSRWDADFQDRLAGLDGMTYELDHNCDLVGYVPIVAPVVDPV